jgi:trimeric autotransporter adhesin
MRLAHPMLLGALGLLLLSGCNFSSDSGSGGSDNAGGTGSGSSGTGTGGSLPIGPGASGSTGPTGSSDSIVATVSVAGTVSVAVGAAQTVSITFTSNDGKTISGFGISGSLATLPNGWSGPERLACAAVNTGSGCVLNLTYAPTAVATGAVSIDYVFVDNSGMPSTGGTVTIAYAGTAHNNVIGAASPTGEVNAVVGGSSQAVSVNFITDDGNVATDLTLTTDMTAVSGWSMAAPSFSCAIVGTGSGCQLPLRFAPASAVRGILTLNYAYTDGSGAARTGSLNIPYSSASQSTVVATAAPAGQINAAIGSAGQAVAVSFTTDDGKPAADLYVTTNLTALPVGWRSAAKAFSCVGVSTGNGCQLHLTYAPLVLGGGTLVLNYAYTAGGTARTGSLNLTYAATTNDNSVATASPTGQINAVVGLGAQTVALTFTTDDGRTATDLQLTSNLAALPAGWSSTATSFSCSGFGSGSACQLPLTYTPTAAGNGTLILAYSYVDNAAESKTGSVNIAYQSTTNNNIVATPTPNSLTVSSGSSTPVSVTFTTDDGNPASGLTVTTVLGTLPSGWSSASTAFNCTLVSTGSTCLLDLTYAPTAADSGTLSLTYSYNSDSGTPKTGSVSIPYIATP